MNKLKYIGLLLLAAFIFNACSDTLEEINADPTRVSDVSLSLQLPEAIVQSYFNEGTNPARVAGLIMKQFEGLDAQQIDYMLYRLPEATMNNYWRTGLYAGALRACKTIINQADEEGAPFYSGVAKILMANQYGLAASYFGNIPMTEALQGIETPQPTFDTQESIYTAVQAMLDDAIVDLTDGGGYGAGDLVYGGDAASWIGVAHAFKARYHMHLSKRTGDYTTAMASVDAAFASADAQPSLTFEASQTGNHALAKFGSERPGTLGFHPEFAAMLGDDPRAAAYFVETDGNFDYWDGGSLVWSKNDATLPLISYVELMMIKAECQAQTGADGSEALTAALNASMAMVGVEGADYVTANGDVSGMSGDAAVEHIVTEAYKAYYGFNFHETWSNYRRTGYPAITPQNNEANGLNPGGQVPKRYLYADSESQTNLANVEAARAAQNGGLLNIAVWAFE